MLWRLTNQRVAEEPREREFAPKPTRTSVVMMLGAALTEASRRVLDANLPLLNL